MKRKCYMLFRFCLWKTVCSIRLFCFIEAKCHILCAFFHSNCPCSNLYRIYWRFPKLISESSIVDYSEELNILEDKFTKFIIKKMRKSPLLLLTILPPLYFLTRSDLKTRNIKTILSTQPLKSFVRNRETNQN